MFARMLACNWFCGAEGMYAYAPRPYISIFVGQVQKRLSLATQDADRFTRCARGMYTYKAHNENLEMKTLYTKGMYNYKLPKVMLTKS